MTEEKTHSHNIVSFFFLSVFFLANQLFISIQSWFELFSKSIHTHTHTHAVLESNNLLYIDFKQRKREGKKTNGGPNLHGWFVVFLFFGGRTKKKCINAKF